MQAEDNGVALVTGAAGGIGAAISSLLAARGWHVAGLDLDRADTELAIQADVTDRAGVRAAAERTADELGEITLLVTAAGVYEMAPVAEIEVERWRRMLAVHLGGTANACWAVLPGMLARGSGTVVTISSELALARQHMPHLTRSGVVPTR